jgi:hypothetical protein
MHNKRQVIFQTKRRFFSTPSDKCKDLALFDKVNDSTALRFQLTLASSFFHFSSK